MAKFSREEYETILCYDFVAKTWSAFVAWSDPYKGAVKSYAQISLQTPAE